MASARQHRLVVRRRAAVFPPRRAPDPRRERTAWRRRAARGVRHGRLRPDQQGVHQERARSRLIRATTTSTAHAGRCRLLPAHHAQRPALFHRRRLPAPGDEAGQSARHHQRADRADHAGWPSRQRRDIPPGRPAAHRARRARSDPVRRRDQLAATAAAVRYRSAAASDRSRHRGGARPARRRPEHAGPLPGAHRLQVPLPDHRQRHHAEQDAHGEDRAAIPAVPQGRADASPRRRPACSHARDRNWPRRTSSTRR